LQDSLLDGGIDEASDLKRDTPSSLAICDFVR